jgi:hypothetical protein
MRTTLTIDEDVAFSLKMIHEGDRDKSFKEVVNEVLRRGLNSPNPKEVRKKFKVRAFPLGLRAGLNLDNIEELLDQVEGPNRK